MKNLKVGIFTEVYHPTMNGVVVSIDTFKRELAKLGVESLVFAPTGRGTKSEEGVVRFPSLAVHPDYPPPLPFLSPQYRRIAQYGLDLIHTQHPFTMGWFGVRAARRLGIPVVTTYHTLIVEYARSHARILPFGPELMRWISRTYCNMVDLVITPSPSMRQVLQQYGVTSRIEVNPTGIYLDHFAKPLRALREQFSIPKERQVLLFVGRLADEKNVRMLLTAFHIVQAERPDTHLLLVSGGPQQQEYERVTRTLGLAQHVTFAGFLPKEKTDQLFGAVDAFVFPSLTDTQGIVIMEAMAGGAPIVAVDALGPGDILTDGETGLLTDNDPAQFARAILNILRNPQLAAKLRTNGKKEAGRYSAQKTAERQRTLYASLTPKSTSDRVRS